MAAARDALPNDIDALKAALLVERAKGLEVTAELAVARAKASEDMALIAQQKLRIAKLERQVYGQRSERSARLIDQLALTFEELEAGATEDELAARPQKRFSEMESKKACDYNDHYNYADDVENIHRSAPIEECTICA